MRKLLIAALLLLAGCTFIDPGGRETLLDRAEAQGWKGALVEAKPFTLFTLSQRRPASDRSLQVIYIEGDGLAWLDRTTVSANPTPQQPVALRLALADPKASLYIGRPCQYLDTAQTARCDPRYWTSHRYAPEVVEALSRAIDRFKNGADGKIELIGYSGGGVLAALIAARRSDVRHIITVAANLDLAAWTRTLGVDEMTASLDPAREANKIGTIAQYHLVGAKDETVPPSVVRSYIGHLPISAARNLVEEVPGYGHTCCWHENWALRIGAVRDRLAP